jgi:hypothetical protein
MNRFGSPKPLTWFTAVLLAALVAGCASSDDATTPAAAPAPATGAGVGTGVGGAGRGPAPVNLLSIATNNFSILSAAGITSTGSHLSVITGNIGASPITAAAMNTVFCSETSGTIYGVDAGYVGSGSQACYMGGGANKTLVDQAVADMGTAYTEAAGRTPDYTELGAGNLGGLNLGPATYKWGTGVLIPTDLTLTGGANDVWIFQIAQDLTVSSGVQIILAGGALPENIFWQTFGAAALDTTSKFQGVILSQTAIAMKTGTTIKGRLLAQTAVTLDQTAVTLAP